MRLLLFGITALFILPALAAEPAAVAGRAPGYADFDDLADEYGEARVMIEVSGSLLRLARAMDHEDPVADAVLDGMESVRIRVYDTHGDSGPAAERMSALSAALSEDGWETVVRAREDGEQVEIFVRQDADRVHGIAVMAVDAEEAVFINVLGNIDPGRIGSVMEQMDLDVDVDIAL